MNDDKELKEEYKSFKELMSGLSEFNGKLEGIIAEWKELNEKEEKQ